MSFELIHTLTGHKSRVWAVKWRKCGKQLASCSADKTIRIWLRVDNRNLNDNEKNWYKCTYILSEGHKRSIRSISWSDCGQYLASCSFDSTTCIWDQKSGDWQNFLCLEGHENETKCVAWSASQRYLATCSRDKTVWIWEKMDDTEYECASVISAHSQDVKKVLWHPKLDVLVSCGYDNTIRFYREEDDDFVNYLTLDQHESTVWSIAFNRDGDKLASCSDDKTVKIWKEISTDKWSCIATLSGFHDGTIYDISWSPVNNLIATACRDNSISIFRERQESDELIYELLTKKEEAHLSDVNCVDWNPQDGNLLASCSDDCNVNIWRITLPED